MSFRAWKAPIWLAAVLSALVFGVRAQASTNVSRGTAPDLAAQIVHDPGSLSSASFVSVPTTGGPNGVSNAYGTVIAPRDGLEMAILSNGDGRAPGDVGYTGHDPTNGTLSGADTRGAFDVTILRLGVTVPSTANCLTVDFDFLTRDFVNAGATSEENFYDSFLAELDPGTPWSVSGATTTALSNFAVDTGGHLVSKASAIGPQTGPWFGYNGANVSTNAIGTGYDTVVGMGKTGGALGWATAMTPVSAGPHTVDLSVFDRGDDGFDSAAAVDNLRYIRRAAGECPKGIQVEPDLDAPTVTLNSPADGSTTPAAPSLSGSAGADPDDSSTVAVKLYAGSSATGSPLQTLSVTRTGGSWQATASPLGPGTYTAQAEQLDAQGNIGASAAHRFTVPAPPTGGGSGQHASGPTDGDDVLNGTPGRDRICGLLGNDTINGLGANDTLFGDACGAKAGAKKDGNDHLNGGPGNDALYGAGGADVLNGGAGNDKLVGGRGKNTYKGGAGNDTISAANKVKESVNCGSGKKDRVTADKKDKVRGCEKVKRKR